VYGADEKCTQTFSSRTSIVERERSRWRDNVKIDVEEIGWEGVVRTNLA
jgi:hypothetical protein